MAKQEVNATESLWAGIRGRGIPALKKAAEKVAKPDGFVTLPGGIMNGVARIVSAGLQKIGSGKNAGKTMFRCALRVVHPTTFTDKDGVTHNLREVEISKMVNLFDHVTEKKVNVTFEEQLEACVNILKLTGYDTAKASENGLELPEMCVAAVKRGGFVKFSTRLGKEILNPDKSVKHAARVWEEWKGEAVGFKMPKAEGVAVSNGKPAAAVTQPVEVAHEEVVEEHEEEVVDTDSADADDETFSLMDAGGDLDSLVAQAEEDNEKAKEQLTEIAIRAGVDKKAIKAAVDWNAVADLIRNAGETATDAEPAGEDEVVEEEVVEEEVAAPVPKAAFAEGETVTYTPVDKKGLPLPSSEAVVLSCDDALKTADIRSGTRIFRGVKHVRLTREEIKKAPPAKKPKKTTK